MGNLIEDDNTSHYIVGLDMLRTIAICGVTFFHMFPAVIQGGYLGVSLFFVLTGFLLAYTSSKSYAAGKFSLGNYYIKRIHRIYPSLILVILLSLGVLSLLTPKILDGMIHELLSVFLGYNNWWQIAQNADYFTRLTNTSPFTHLWFLGIELQYYLVWPLIFLFYMWVERMFGAKASFGCLAILTVASTCVMPLMYSPDMDITRLYYGTDTRVYALLLGALFGLTYRTENTKNSGVDSVVLFLITAGITLGAYVCLDGRNPVTYKGGMLAITLIFCLMLYIITHNGMAYKKLVEHKIFAWIGQKSYAIFLWQYPVLYVFKHMHWTSIPCYAFIEIIIIVVLSIWTDWLSECLIKKKSFGSEIHSSVLRGIAIIILCIISIALIGKGYYGLAQASPKTKKELQAELQAQLEAKAKALELERQQELQRQQEKAKAEEAKKKEVAATMHHVICVGDSVMLQASPALKKLLPGCYVNAEISRYVGGGQEVIHQLKQEGRLGKIVVISLGTNGPISGGQRYEVQTLGLLKDLGDDIHVFWVNTYGEDLEWQDANNKFLAKLAAEHKNLTIIDWYSIVSRHKEWLEPDGIHPTDDGSTHFAEVIRSSIEKKLMGDFGLKK